MQWESTSHVQHVLPIAESLAVPFPKSVPWLGVNVFGSHMRQCSVNESKCGMRLRLGCAEDGSMATERSGMHL